MSFNYATQPELIRASQKDSEIIQQIYENLYSLLEYVFPSRVIYNHINTLKLLSNIAYYSLTYLQENKKTIGEEYTNIQSFNYSDYDNHYVQIFLNKQQPLQRKRRILFIVIQFLSFSITKLRQKMNMFQQQHQSSLIKNLPDLNNIVEGVQEVHLALFLIHGTYFEIAKRLTATQYIFNRIPPTHNITYKRIGQAYLIVLFFSFLRSAYTLIKKVKNSTIKEQVNQERNINEDAKTFTQCLICYDDATNLTCTPCGHLYCWDCIGQQISIKQQCPICRANCAPQQLVLLNNYN